MVGKNLIKKMKKILDISVVIPCFNANETLLRTLKSVFEQKSLPSEIIVVDDGSDTPIEPLIAKYASQISIPIRLITQPNLGAPAARNVGIQAAQSSYVAFLDADDIWFPEKLQIQYDVMVSRKLTICCHGYNFNQNEKSIPHATVSAANASFKNLSKLRFAFGNPVFTPTVMVTKQNFTGFDERFRRVDDYKAWLENFQAGQFGYIDIVLAAGFKHPIGQSGLTGSIDRMHESYLEVLASLLEERRINLFFYFFARLIEAIKFPLRRHLVNKKLNQIID